MPGTVDEFRAFLTEAAGLDESVELRVERLGALRLDVRKDRDLTASERTTLLRAITLRERSLLE